jgi:methylenetetrahydrofolate--tRNA-(uracil-5-)-methyltransferase
MNINFGLFPPLPQAPAKSGAGVRLRGPVKAAAKKQALCRRALDDLEHWLCGRAAVAAE